MGFNGTIKYPAAVGPLCCGGIYLEGDSCYDQKKKRWFMLLFVVTLFFALFMISKSAKLCSKNFVIELTHSTSYAIVSYNLMNY